VNYGIIGRVLGMILIIESILMSPSLFISVYTRGEDQFPFIITMFIIFVIGGILYKIKVKDSSVNTREALAIVALGWIILSLAGALPLYLSKVTETYIDAFFEIVAGFTTTGVSVISNIEQAPLGILFWRSFTHWIGGMGILVFTVALLPILGIGGFQIFKAESPGPIAGKVVPRIRDTAMILYITYFIMTIAQILLLIFGGMGVYEAFIHTFATMGTGGFEIREGSVGFYNINYIHLVIAIFMTLSGVNFSIYYLIYKRKFKEAFLNEEFRLYLGIIIMATIVIGLNLYFTNYASIGYSIKDAFFQASATITTTGYSTADLKLWPSFSRGILTLLMLIGGSAGSTAGGIKVIRILIMFKLIKREVLKLFHPRAIIPIKINNRAISNEVVAGIYSFIALYFVIFIFGTLIISLEGIDLINAGSATIGAISNLGNLKFVGSLRSLSEYSQFSKLFLSFLMLLGRLELFTIIALIVPKNWRRVV